MTSRATPTLRVRRLWGLEEAGCDVAGQTYQRGLRYLLETQCEDGSWKVETRVKPIQVYFDNGDPHGKHQIYLDPGHSLGRCCAGCRAQGRTFGTAVRPLDPRGKIVDGTGNPWFLGDVAVRGDRIVAIGPLPADAKATKVINAQGLVVSPGFIDMHSHSDRPLTRGRQRAEQDSPG